MSATTRTVLTKLTAVVTFLSLAPLTMAASVPAESMTTEDSPSSMVQRDLPGTFEASLAGRYPTRWYGPVPPLPPCGYSWLFIGFDCNGVAHWRLVRVF